MIELIKKASKYSFKLCEFFTTERTAAVFDYPLVQAPSMECMFAVSQYSFLL